MRIADFFYRDLADPDTDEVPLRCRDCGFEFSVPLDWADSHIGAHSGCPGCSMDSRIPGASEAEWPYAKHESDPMAGVGMTDRGGTG